MDNIQLDDLVYSYPLQDDPDFQTIISSKQEFRELASTVNEPIPRRGEFFKYQSLVIRFMQIYDRLFVKHNVGTGKSAVSFGTSEFLKESFLRGVSDFVDEYVKPGQTNIKQVIILTKGKNLINELKYQLICRVTTKYEEEINRKRQRPVQVRKPVSDESRGRGRGRGRGGRGRGRGGTGSRGTGSRGTGSSRGGRGGGLTRGRGAGAPGEGPPAPRIQRSNKEEVRRRTLATNEIKAWYKLSTYGTFVSKLLREGLTDEEIKRRYSDTLFIVDEVQNLHLEGDNPLSPDDESDVEKVEEVNTKETTDKERIYRTLWKIFHTIQRSKVMLLSATPMINNPQEIIPIMNLLLPVDRQMPANILDGNKFTADQLEPYFRGLVSYVREAGSGAVPTYQGETTEYLRDGQPVESHFKTWNTQMSGHQTEAYLRTSRNPGSFDIRLRQTSNFVFPDGSFGGAGFKRHFKKLGSDVYQPSAEIIPYLNDLEELATLSSKYTSIIELCNESPGNCFVYSDFVGSGAVLIGQCFLGQGYTQYTESNSAFTSTGIRGATNSYCTSTDAGTGSKQVRITKGTRYALLTGETSDAQTESILELFNSPENAHGEYIKVIITSPIARVGINLNNVVQIHLVGPGWNQSNTYQAISRAIRATSHQQLVQEEAEKLTVQGLDPANARVDIEIYQHASIPDAEVEPVDIKLYETSEQKDMEIKQVDRILNQVAVDCQIQYKRNVRTSDVDGSSECAYQECQYSCFNPAPDDIDYSSYNVLYSSQLVDGLIVDILSLFKKVFKIRVEELYAVFRLVQSRYVDVAVTKIINDRTFVYDRYGFRNYLRVWAGDNDDQVELYLVPLDDAETSHPSSLYYTQNLIVNDHATVSELVEQLNHEDQQPTVETIRAQGLLGPALAAALAPLGNTVKADLVEQAIVATVNGTNTTQDDEIIASFRESIYQFNEPVTMIRQNIEIERGKRAETRGRPKTRNIDTSSASAKQQELLEFQYDPDTDDVFMHLLNVPESETAYTATADFTRAKGIIRLYKPSEGGAGWRDLETFEYAPYNKLVRASIAQKLDPFETKARELGYGLYGFVLQDGVLRIRDIRDEEQRTKLDKRFQRNGRACANFGKPDIVDILWNIKLNPTNISTGAALTRLQIMNFLRSQKVESKFFKLEDFDDDRLRFFYRWYISQISKEQMCILINKYLDEQGLIYRS